MKETLPIIEKWFQLTKWSIPVLGRFPRDQRFLMADKIESLEFEVLEELLSARFANRKDTIVHLRAVNLKLEKLRYYLRMAEALKYINRKRYHHWVLNVNETGRMTGGWIKKIQTTG